MTNEQLVLEYQAGNREALEQLYLQNMKLIDKIIRRYGGNGELEDLRQESYFGIVKAAEPIQGRMRRSCPDTFLQARSDRAIPQNAEQLPRPFRA